MARGFKSGGRQKGSRNKPKELVLNSTQRAATAGNARVHAKVIPALKLTPLEMMLANMEWAWDEAAVMLKDITRDPNISGEAKLEAYKVIACNATPKRRHHMCILSSMPWRPEWSRRRQPKSRSIRCAST